MNRIQSIYVILVLVFLAWSIPVLANGEVDITVTAEGVAAVFDGDVGRAEDEALNDAKRNAVEQAIGVFVKSETMGVDYQIVKNTLLTRSEGYIISWEKIEGSRRIDKVENDCLLRIKIRARVGLIKLIGDMTDIEEVYNAMQRPRVMVLLDELNLDKRGGDFPASTAAVIRTLQDRRFDVVDESVLEQLRRKESTRAILERGDTRAAALLALDEGAEIVVLGKAKAYKTDLPYGLGDDVVCCSARLDAKIVFADTGQILFTPKPTEGRGVDFGSWEKAGLNALDDAGSKLISADADRFAAQVLANWAKEVQNGRILRVTASDISYEEFTAIKKAIREFRGYVGVVRESYQSKTGTLDVRFKLAPDEFRERLMAVKVGGKKVEVSRAFGSTTTLTLK